MPGRLPDQTGLEETYDQVMQELQQEWERNRNLHLGRHFIREGIRSSQTSALVMLLIKKGILKSESGGNILNPSNP